MAAFTYLQAEEIRDALKRHGAQYLSIGQSGAMFRESLPRLRAFRNHLRRRQDH